MFPSCMKQNSQTGTLINKCMHIHLVKKKTTKNKSVTILMNLKILQSATNIGNLSSALEELNANPVGILFIPWDISRHNTNKRI